MKGPHLDRYALISDIHGNLEALQSVLKDIAAHGIEEIVCLGDIVGYGPDPDACVDLVRARCQTVLKGNHDDALFNGCDRFNPFARAAIRYSRDRLKPGLLRGRAATERWQWLRDLPVKAQRESALFVHGSPRDPVNEYIYQEDVYFNADSKLREIFSAFDRLLFCGHTHMPVIIRSDYATFVPTDGDGGHEIDARYQYIVNVGSVGQPRDRDARAAWVACEGQHITHHRVAYDIEETVRKIAKQPLLDEILGARLGKGM